MHSPVARIFLSSTFRDFGEERDLLVRRVFPALRARLRERFVELVDVDLRWGITVEQAERGEVLPICLAEIDRARPWFVGMLGDRYGWVPEADAYDQGLVDQRPWLDEHRGGKSVTELEILHGVLNDPAMAGRALFYFRAPDYAHQKGGDYLSASIDDAAKLDDLKDRILASGFPVVENYGSPNDLAAQLEADLWAVLDEAYPAEDTPDAFTREQRKHEAYAAPRRRLYFGGDAYKAALTTALEEGCQRLLITGQSGGGKSALIANWLDAYRQTHPADQVFEYYLGASSDASTPTTLARHLIEHIKRITLSDGEISGDPQALFDSLPMWLAYASSHAGKENYRWVITLDGFNGLSDLRDLRWWPQFLPDRVHIVVSCLAGQVLEALRAKGDWHEIAVEPLNINSARDLLRAYLGQYNKTLAASLEARALAHPLAINPLFLRTLAEELRLFGSHEELSDRLDHYLTSRTVDDLFERLLERVEEDSDKHTVQTVLTALWASRSGLTEQEILAYAELVPATWAPIRLALDNALLESSGRITFAHDYMKIAVSDRYMAGNNELDDTDQSLAALGLRRQSHQDLARFFGGQPVDARTAEELPYQWVQAKAWDDLKTCLTQRPIFEAMIGHRGQEELLGYWLDLERETGVDLATDYEAAWVNWAPDHSVIETGDLGSSLEQFLSFSGRYSEFTVNLARISLYLDEKIRGKDSRSAINSLDNLASQFRATGNYASAEPLYRRALAVAEKAYGPEHPTTGVSLNNLAGLHNFMGDYAAAEPLYRRALAIAEMACGSEHPETGTRLSNLAVLLNRRGDYDAALSLFQRALTIAERVLGHEHRETGTRLNNLARLLQDMGNYVAAEALYRRASAIAEKARGPEHPETGIGLCNLASLLKHKGDYAEAESLYSRALAIAEKSQGLEHDSVGSCLNGLAGLLQEKGEYAAAEHLYRRALSIAERALGPAHPETGTYLNNLALVLLDMGDTSAAEPLFRRALAIAEQTQGPEHPSTGTSLNNLACLLHDIGELAAAEPFYRRALAIAEKADGPEHPSTGTSFNNLARLLHDMGNYAVAEPLFRRALAIAEEAQGPEHPVTAIRLNSLALLLKGMGDYGAAESLFRRLLTIQEKVLGFESAHVGSTVYSLGQILLELGRADDAETCFRRELAIAAMNDGECSVSFAASLYNIGNFLAEHGQWDEGESCLRQELAITEEIEGPQSESLAGSHYNLGVNLRNQGKLDLAEAELWKALSIWERIDANSLDLAYTLSALGKVYALQGDKGQARNYYDRSLNILHAQAEPDQDYIGDVEQRIAELDGE